MGSDVEETREELVATRDLYKGLYQDLKQAIAALAAENCRLHLRISEMEKEEKDA